MRAGAAGRSIRLPAPVAVKVIADHMFLFSALNTPEPHAGVAGLAAASSSRDTG